MEISQLSLALFCLVSFVFGVVYGAVYDLISPLPSLFFKVHSKGLNEKLYKSTELSEKRKRTRRLATNTAVFFHDLLYMFFFGVAFSVLIYICNDGIFRYSALLGMILGLLLYKKLLRRAVLAFSELVRFALWRAVLFAVSVVKVPFTFIMRVIKRINAKAQKARLEKQITRYSNRMQTELLALSERGFVFEPEKTKKQRKGKDGHERRGKKEKINNTCDIVSYDGICNRCGCKSDELQSTS